MNILRQKGRIISKGLLILSDDKMNPVTKRDIFPLSSERRAYCNEDTPNEKVCEFYVRGHPYMTSALRGGVSPKEDVVREVA